MKHIISVRTAVAIGLSAIIGDTLFAVTGVPISQAGSNSLVAYLIVGFFAVMVAMVFGELSSLMPKEKGLAYSYVKRTFGSQLGFITGIMLYMGYCTIISAVSFSFGGYLLLLFGISSVALQIGVAICLILFIAFLNTLGLKETTSLTGIFAGVTVLTAIVFVAYALTHQPVNVLANFANSAAQNGFAPFEAAITAVVFAYAGFQTVASISDNVKGGGSGVAKAMVCALLISAAAYIAVTFALIVLVPASQFVSNASPLEYALLYSNAPAYLDILITIGSLIAIAASLITLVMTSSRLIYQMGRDGLLPSITRRYSKERDVAVNGIWISAVIAIAALFSGNIYTMLSISNFGIIFSWLMGGLVLINLRRRRIRGPFEIPYHPYSTIIAMIACICFLFGLPKDSLSVGVALILVLIIAYYTIIEIKYKKANRVRLFD